MQRPQVKGAEGSPAARQVGIVFLPRVVLDISCLVAVTLVVLGLYLFRAPSVCGSKPHCVSGCPGVWL